MAQPTGIPQDSLYIITKDRKYNVMKLSWGCSSLTKSVCLTHLRPWIRFPAQHKTVGTHNPSTRETEAGEAKIQGHPQLCIEFKAIL